MRIKPDEPAIQPQATEIKSNSTQPTQAEKTNLGIASTWDTFVSQTADSGGAVDPNALVQHVLKESYLQTTEDLKFYADKVKYFNEQKKHIRDYVQNLRDSDSPQKNEALKLVDQLKAGGNNNNLMEALTVTIKETIKDSNENKKYYLQQIATLNKHSKSLSDEMRVIADASTRLASAEKKDDDD